MTTLEIIGQIFGILASIACIITAQLPQRWQILLGNVFVNILSALNLPMIGAGFAACGPCIVAVIHCGYNIYTDKKEIASGIGEKVFFSFLYLVAWGVGFGISCANGTASALDFIPLVATAFFVLSVFMKKERLMRLCLLGNAGVYIIYDILIPNTAIIAHTFTVVSILIALYRYRKKTLQDTTEIEL